MPSWVFELKVGGLPYQSFHSYLLFSNFLRQTLIKPKISVLESLNSIFYTKWFWQMSNIGWIVITTWIMGWVPWDLELHHKPPGIDQQMNQTVEHATLHCYFKFIIYIFKFKIFVLKLLNSFKNSCILMAVLTFQLVIHEFGYWISLSLNFE